MKRLTAFIMQDDYTSFAIYRQVDGSFVYENLGHMGELYEPGGFYGLRDLLRGLFPSAPQVEELETACGAVADVDESADLVPDVEMLGSDGDPGDRILPEELVSSGDPILDEALAEDVFDLGEGQEFPPLDRGIYTVYFVQAERNATNPYGSRDSFAGIAPVFECRRRSDCRSCYTKYGQVPESSGVLEFDTPCRAAWERHPISWEGAQVRSLPAFFQVIATLPRRLREGHFKAFRGRDGRLHTVQMKDRPYVVVRWGDLDEDGNFVPGVEDPDTGERVERISVMPAWALYNIRTGEKFKYEEPTAPVRLNTAFRQKILDEAVRRQPDIWQRALHPRRLGIKWWRVVKDGDGYVVVSIPHR